MNDSLGANHLTDGDKCLLLLYPNVCLAVSEFYPHQGAISYPHRSKDFVGSQDKDRDTSHIVLTTHNPLAVAELVKEQIQILKRDQDSLKVSAMLPDIDPRGMGYSGIVTSDMFGLAAAVDSQTLELLEAKRKLIGKEGPLTEKERDDLEKINLELEGYGFRYEMRDPVFAEYLKARYLFDKEQPEMRKMVGMSAADCRNKAKKLVQQALAKAKQEG